MGERIPCESVLISLVFEIPVNIQLCEVSKGEGKMAQWFKGTLLPQDPALVLSTLM